MSGASTLSIIFSVLGVVCIGLSGIVLLRTLTLKPLGIDLPPCKPYDTDFITANKDLLRHFSRALQFETVSRELGSSNTSELLNMQKWITDTFPIVHSSPIITKEVVAKYSLLYTVKGTDSSLKPFLLMSHLDVVPVNQEEWAVPAFDGLVDNQFIHGRGAIDAKQIVVGILEALEFLLKMGHKPKRPFYIAFGHDEEIGGPEGAHAIAKLLQSRDVQLEFLLDEGMPITDGVLPGFAKPIALIGTSEKGSLTVKLTVKAPGGHSSVPPAETSIGILANAVARLEANPHKNMFGSGPEKAMMEQLAHEMGPFRRTMMSNLWLFSPVVSWVMSKIQTSNALVRTTTAVTMFNAGVKSNVLAPHAEAVVNHRIHPAQTVREVLDYDKKIVNDERVQFKVLSSMEPHPQSPYDDGIFGYQTIRTSILQVWGDTGVVTAPGVMVGNTDTRHYLNLTSCVYRFSPSYLYPEDVPRFHGKNERISIKNYEQAVNFYYHLILNSDKEKLTNAHTHSSEL